MRQAIQLLALQTLSHVVWRQQQSRRFCLRLCRRRQSRAERQTICCCSLIRLLAYRGACLVTRHRHLFAQSCFVYSKFDASIFDHSFIFSFAFNSATGQFYCQSAAVVRLVCFIWCLALVLVCKFLCFCFVFFC